MTIDDLNEAAGILQSQIALLQAAVPATSGVSSAAFRYACGDFLAQITTNLQAGAISAALLDCFTQAVGVGATVVGMDAVRSTMEALSPTGVPGQIVANLGLRFALSAEARILSQTTFTSSQDALTALTNISVAFDSAQIFAADNHNPACYQALIALEAKVVADLTTRAANLPQLVTYSLARSMTSHALANFLYGDAGQADELRAENKVRHPAFMPTTGTALSQA